MSFSMQIDWHCECGDGEGSHRTTPEGEQCWGHCQKTPRDCGNKGYRPFDHSQRTPAIEAILAIATHTRWPEHYTCDLSTDYQGLIGYSGSFVWVLRQMGTHLFKLEVEGQDREWQRGYITSSLRWMEHNQPGARVFHWNATKGSLIEVTYDTVHAVVAPYLVVAS